MPERMVVTSRVCRKSHPVPDPKLRNDVIVISYCANDITRFMSRGNDMLDMTEK
jgi:hypothetical protein